MLKVSALWVGWILFAKSHSPILFLFIFRLADKLFISCFLGWENPALTILKKISETDLTPGVSPSTPGVDAVSEIVNFIR